jgi:triosephosphate isomerase
MEKLRTPVIIVNYKTYKEATGENAVTLTKILEEAAKAHGANIIVAVQQTDIRTVADSCSLHVFSEHIDAIGYGGYTGFTLPEAVKAAGAVGTLINHAEHRLKLADIDAAVTRAKENGLITVVCTNNASTSKAAAVFSPDFVAIEPPELIGGDISVTTANPDVVRSSVEAVKAVNKNVSVLCGAGVKTGADVKKALELGTDGVLLASGVVKAKEPKKVIEDLISGLH